MKTNITTYALKKSTVNLAIALCMLLGLAGCSGDSSTPPIVPSPPPVPDSVPQINPPQSFAGSLTQANAAAVSIFIKNGIFTSSMGSFPSLPSSNDAISGGAESAARFSTTNTQEEGVDEADRIEFDGSHFFVADYPVWNREQSSESGVRILARQDDNSLVEINRLGTPNEQGSINGIYLANVAASNQQHLAIISGEQPSHSIEPFANTVFAPAGFATSFDISVYNVTDKQNISSPDVINIEGGLISTRRIENNLYIVSTHIPEIDNLDNNTADPQVQLANYQKIIATPDSELLPAINLNNSQQNLLSLDDCYIPQQATENDGYAQIIQIVKIDLTNVQNMQAMCMSALTTYSYMSSDSIYLTGNLDNATSLHKVSFRDQLGYQASGIVPGIIDWRGQPELRLSEFQDTLRILTSDYFTNTDDPEHVLFNLQQQGESLTIVGQLPNDTYPDPIGKPGEDVFAVRYVGEKGYVVTFEQIDPLYVLGLNDPTLPTLLGELEVPGFSSYLQPFGNDLLLGIGQQVNLQALPENGEPNPPQIMVQSMKVSLFDVRDPANPIEVGNITKEDSYTPVEFDYRALSVLSIDDTTQFAMPVESWGASDLTDFGMPANSLMIFDVVDSPSATELSLRFEFTAPAEQNNYVYVGEDRSVITEQGYYYLRGNHLWFHSNIAGDEPLGPF